MRSGVDRNVVMRRIAVYIVHQMDKYNNILIIYKFYYPILWYNNKITMLYVTVKDRPLPHSLHFYITVALPDNGRHYRAKHVVVNVMNK